MNTVVNVMEARLCGIKINDDEIISQLVDGRSISVLVL